MISSNIKGYKLTHFYIQ